MVIFASWDGTSPRKGDFVTRLPGQGQTSRGRLQWTAPDADGGGPPRAAGLSHLVGPAGKSSPRGGKESLICAIGEPLSEVNREQVPCWGSQDLGCSLPHRECTGLGLLGASRDQEDVVKGKSAGLGKVSVCIAPSVLR